MSTAGKVTVLFLPDSLVAHVEAGTSILQAAMLAGLELKSNCGGAGTCGRCQVRIKDGFVKDEAAGDNAPQVCPASPVLACQTLVDGHVVVDVPQDSRLALHQVLLGERDVLKEQDIVLGQVYKLQPLCRKIRLTLAEPTLVGNFSDWSRLQTALREEFACSKIHISLPVLRTLPETLRTGAWQVTATVVELDGCADVVLLEPGHSLRPAFGLAIDIGTTTVVVYLLDLETGLTLGKKGTYNKQARFGEDVITRIVYATEKEQGLSELHEAVIATVNQLIAELLAENGISGQDVHLAVVAGNTTMTHLFFALSPKYIRLEPYIPLSSFPPPARAAELGLTVNPHAYVVSFPAVASYVGGDIVAGTLLTGMARGQEVTLFIDIGTNGEMVLGNRDWLISVACSAGPAFEGGGITFGMRAMKGAIERVEIDPKTYEVTVETIGDVQPLGVCGSGLIDCLAKLRAAGIIDRAGKMQTGLATSRLRQGDDGPEFILVFAEAAAGGKDIVLTENDSKNLLRAKAAVYAGIRCLLKSVQLEQEGIEKVLVAGGFGSHINIRDAVAIGLLPDLPADKYIFIGNSAVKGARQGLLSQEAFREALELGKRITYLELSAGNDFLHEFVSALFLPHTDRSLFPSVIG
ncbi:MAG: DUF4445 domain-containing protein [Dethiobacter sp.]|nr:DUF4445 domain-containing protein [Dethiobacter sp.]